jgi:membrane protein implicated in regulation of membrane protease activity
MKLLVGKSGTRLNGAELVIAGAVVLVLKALIAPLAPLALALFGGYRLLISKSYPDGIISIALGIVLYVFLKTTLNLVLWIVGAAMLVYGTYLLIFPRSKTTEKDVS